MCTRRRVSLPGLCLMLVVLAAGAVFGARGSLCAMQVGAGETPPSRWGSESHPPVTGDVQSDTPPV